MASVEALSAQREHRPPTHPISSPKRPVSATQESANDESSLVTTLAGLGITALLVWAGYKVGTEKYYTPRSYLGFYLGVAGSVMMLTLLLYPLRKHLRVMHRWGALKHWFRWHMILGILGPILVLFHSTFHLRSLNATVALVSMLLVVSSGIIGRFVYTKIHYGLYGRRASLSEIQHHVAGHSGDIQSRFAVVPQVSIWLSDFEQEARHIIDGSGLMMGWDLLRLSWKRRLCERRCASLLRQTLTHSAHPEFPQGAPEALHLVRCYLHGVERVAEFSTYEQWFSSWHILHIPLIYLLAASSVFHIIAVYMY